MGAARKIIAADLFCGAGGTSTGLKRATDELGLELDLTAVNHWPMAVQTHWANHKKANHFCQDLKALPPRKAVPGGHLDLLVASPECRAYSPARGAKPFTDQRRTSPREILRWVDALDVDNLLVENVREFRDWGPEYTEGPNTGRPIPEFSGIFYKRFTDALRDRFPYVDERVLNAADYGDPTTRRRLFIQARRRPVTWPTPSHTPATWRPAREIIDWSIPGTSIFGRKRPLKPSTLARIFAGIKKFAAEPFLTMFYGTNDVRSLDRPLPTVTADGQHIGIAQFLLQQQSGGAPRHVSLPVPTVATKGAIGFVQAYLVPFFGERAGQAPRTHSLDEPTPAVTSHGAGGLAQAFIIPTNHGDGDLRAHSLAEPMRTLTGVDAWALVEPLILKYFGTGIAKPVSMPLDTVTTRDRFGLVQTVGGEYGIDILFRMLEPHELKRAMSFGDDYMFCGSRSEVVKQIGNAVPVETAKALCKTILAA